MPLLNPADPVAVALDASGDTVSGAKLNVFLAGTSTPASLYSNSALSTAISNPVVFDSSGRPSTEIYVAAGSYKIDLTTPADISLPGYPIDNVGVLSSGVDNFTATAAPTVNDDSDDGYDVGSRWVDVTNDNPYTLVDATPTAAVWFAHAARNASNTYEGNEIWSKGADIASAGALTLGTDGNSFDVTGTTTITSISSLGAGASVLLQFDGSLTLTHHATDLVLPGAQNIQTSAGETAIFWEYATGDWMLVGGTLLDRALRLDTQATATGNLTIDLSRDASIITTSGNITLNAVSNSSAKTTWHPHLIVITLGGTHTISYTTSVFDNLDITPPASVTASGDRLYLVYVHAGSGKMELVGTNGGTPT